MQIKKKKSVLINQFPQFLRKLWITKQEFSNYLGVARNSVGNWAKKGPYPTPAQRQLMIEDGINPLYWDGYGEVVLQGFTVDQVSENIQKRIEAKNGKAS